MKRNRKRAGAGMTPDEIINLMRSVKRGEKTQKRSLDNPNWRDDDLRALLSQMVQWRAKPQRK